MAGDGRFFFLLMQTLVVRESSVGGQCAHRAAMHALEDGRLADHIQVAADP